VCLVVEPAGGSGVSVHGRAGAADQRLRDSGGRGQASLGRLPGGGRPMAPTGIRSTGENSAGVGLETAFSGQVARGFPARVRRSLVKLD
jgi:hypothetical protein